VSGLEELRSELAELLGAIERLREACPPASGTQPPPPRELVEELTRRDAQARHHLSAATYAALPSLPPGPDMTCAQFWLRCMDLLEAVRAYKHERAPRDANRP
jgi:hypothetical protein